MPLSEVYLNLLEKIHVKMKTCSITSMDLSIFSEKLLLCYTVTIGARYNELFIHIYSDSHRIHEVYSISNDTFIINDLENLPETKCCSLDNYSIVHVLMSYIHKLLKNMPYYVNHEQPPQRYLVHTYNDIEVVLSSGSKLYTFDVNYNIIELTVFSVDTDSCISYSVDGLPDAFSDFYHSLHVKFINDPAYRIFSSLDIVKKFLEENIKAAEERIDLYSKVLKDLNAK